MDRIDVIAVAVSVLDDHIWQPLLDGRESPDGTATLLPDGQIEFCTHALDEEDKSPVMDLLSLYGFSGDRKSFSGRKGYRYLLTRKFADHIHRMAISVFPSKRDCWQEADAH